MSLKLMSGNSKIEEEEEDSLLQLFLFGHVFVCVCNAKDFDCHKKKDEDTSKVQLENEVIIP